MSLREQDKHFLWSLYMAIAIIFAWKGIWDGIYEIPYVGNPWVFLFIGFAMLTFSGLIFKEFDPLGGLSSSVKKVLNQVSHHPRKKDFVFKYYDKARKKEVSIDAKSIQRIEKGALVIKHGQKKIEVFIPAHRLTEILYKGERYCRL